MAPWGEYWYPPHSVPRKAKGGIKARSKRGAFATTWWGERWIAVLESFHLGARLGRGWSYARKGQVIGLEIGTGEVTAEVQGSRASPYSVSIEIEPVAAAKWRELAATVAEDMAVAARLLAGELPPAIEGVFEAAGAPLFPSTVQDLETYCSCPDWSNPCKHIAAVYYLLAEEFDRDPFLLFRLRGMERRAFVALMGFGAGEGPLADREEGAAEVLEPEPLPADADAFWTGSGRAEDLVAEVTVPPRSVSLAAGLGGIPFWRGEEDFLGVVAALSDGASERGLRAFLGGAEPGAAGGTEDSQGPQPRAKGRAPRSAAKPAPTAKKAKPATAIARSIGPGYLVCLDCGRKLKSLARHLSAAHGLSAEAYRARWQLPEHYPLTARGVPQPQPTSRHDTGKGRGS